MAVLLAHVSWRLTAATGGGRYFFNRLPARDGRYFFNRLSAIGGGSHQSPARHGVSLTPCSPSAPGLGR